MTTSGRAARVRRRCRVAARGSAIATTPSESGRDHRPDERQRLAESPGCVDARAEGERGAHRREALRAAGRRNRHPARRSRVRRRQRSRRSITPERNTDRLAGRDCEDGCDRPLRRGDRRHDRDLADRAALRRRAASRRRCPPRPQRASRSSGAPRTGGMPSITARGAVTVRPTSITQATAEGAPIIFVERDEQSVAVAQHAAAPSPPSRAITRVFVQVYLPACLIGLRYLASSTDARP